MNVLLLRWDTKPDKRIRGTFLRPASTCRTSFYAADRFVTRRHGDADDRVCGLILTPGTIWGYSAISGPDRDVSTRHRDDENAISLAERPRREIVAERYFHGMFDGVSLRPGSRWGHSRARFISL
jgi:hypothetical protein